MRTVVISGAGSGIGRAIAQKLAAQNYTVMVLGLNREKLTETRALLENPDTHSVVVADVRDKAAIAAGLRDSGIVALNGVVANAGVGGENLYGENDRWDEVLATNLTGVYYLVNECLPYLRKGAGETKHVVLMSSILARLGVPDYSAYCASKAGLLGLMRSWAVQFAPDNILVNSICPGWVETEMAREGIKAFAEKTGQPYAEAYRRQMSQVLLRRMSQPEEIASLVSYLFSNEQTSFTGQVFDMNNGALMV